MTKPHHIAEWARVRETSLEIAEAIFELAHDDETLAQQIWEEVNDKVMPLALAKTDKDQLYWGDETIDRRDV